MSRRVGGRILRDAVACPPDAVTGTLRAAHAVAARSDSGAVNGSGPLMAGRAVAAICTAAHPSGPNMPTPWGRSPTAMLDPPVVVDGRPGEKSPSPDELPCLPMPTPQERR